MKNKLPKILTTLFLSLFVLQIFSLLFLLTAPIEVRAIEFTPQVKIGEYFTGGEIGPTSIGKYISAVYKYAIGIVGILATVIMMYGGITWLTSGGSQEKIGEAKSWIVAALSGLLLTMASFLILATINPKLVEIQPITPTPVDELVLVDKSNYIRCYWTNNVDNTKFDIKDEAYCPDSAQEHPGTLCACEKKPEIESGYHKKCFKERPLIPGGDYTYFCQLVSGTGANQCENNSDCNESNSSN